MNIFNNIKVNTKILLGFLIILVLMGMVGGVALFQVSRINATVINLADNLAKDQHLADQMVSKILLVRFYANKYIQKQKLEKLNRFNEEFADFEQLLAKANQKISKPERIEMLAIIKEGVQLYGKYFKQVTQLMDQRYQIINKVLDIQGPLAEEKLEQLRESAFKADDRIAAFYAAHFQRALLLMRLDVFKYLQEGEQEWLEKFEKRYQESQTAFNKLEQELQDPNRRQLAQQAQTAIELYHQSFIRLQANYVQQHQIIETQLNIIGPKIRKNASKMSNSVRIDFNQANKATQTLVTHTWLGLLMIMGLAIIIGLSLGIVIARSITHPLKIMVKMSEHLLAGQMEQLVAIQHHQRLKQMMSRRDEMGNIVCIFNALASYFQGIIEDIVQVSQELARGHLNVKFQSKYQGDFAQIKNALQTALSNQQRVIQDIVQVSQGLAQGHLRVMPQVEYQGDFRQIKEALEIALMDLRQVIEDIVQVSQEIAEGKNVTFQAEYRGDFTQSQKALEMAADKLADTMNKNTQQNWLKTGQNKLNEQISGVQNIVELTHNVVSFLTVYLKAQIGICYLINQMPNTHQNHQLEIVASYAQARRKNLLEEFQFGQGLVEQAAKELKMLLIKIETGLEDKLIPRYLLMMPFLYENKIKGVIVLGTLEILTEIQQDFLHQVMPNIGIAVNSVESQTQMQQLLQQTQIQAKELQTQRTQLQQSNEELQNQSEELQSQSGELQSQSEELHTQAEELRQSNEELEARTQELERQKSEIYNKNLTLEETQQSLEAKAQELELASRYKSEFLANISHELRTPLNSLLILSQLLIDNKPANLTEKQIEYAQTIHNAGIDLLNLINDILDLSKVEAGKIELNLEHFSINDFIESLKLKFNPVAENKGLAFHIQLADNISTSLNTDGQRLKQIINNLLANAFKFTHQGEIKLTIQRTTEQFLLTHTAQKEEPENLSNSPLAQPETEKNFILISVSDTGIGIPIDKQEVIFEAFQQADGTTNRRYGGTGLGLSISRQLARLLGGDLQLQSEEGQGSTFTLYLPETHSLPMNISTFVASSSPSASSSSPSSSSPSASSSSLEAIKNFSNFIPVEKISDDRHTLKPTDKSILIIEDDQNFSNILMELAKEKQFKCLLAEDGKTGLQLAQAYKPSAILLDIGLPQIDGWTVMEQLKDDLETRHIPVYFLSAFDQSLTAQKMGAFGYLIKPLNKAQLGEVFDKIEQFLTQITKKLLVVVDNPLRQQEILELIVGKDIQMISKASVEVAFEPADTMQYDCIILDLNIEPATGYQLLERIQMEKNVFQVPIVIYAQHDLNAEEASLLQQYAKEIPIKLVHSVADLLDQATLFLHQAETKLSEKKRNLLKMVHDKTPILKDKRVLIVDDDVRNTFALTTILEDKQMEVVCAQNGDRALEQLKNHEDIAIILMDIMMPKMDGYETMRQIRKQSRYQKLPIIALTAKAMKGDKAKCIEAGANDYLSKPIDTEKLISLMRVWLYH